MLEPKPHQIEAIKANVLNFETQDRIKNIMACGTGKTLVAIKTIDKLILTKGYSSIVIFVPTIMLIQQFMSNILSEFGRNSYSYAVVCSRRNLNVDDMDANEIAIEFNVPVLNDGNKINAFFKKKTSDTQIIFCTYASSKLLEGRAFDLGVFDESHKTAGQLLKPYSYALYDENIAIKKRLFLTATERVQFTHTDNRIGMNSIDVYGKTSYSLSFRRAIDLGLIVDYKLLVTVVHQSDIAHLIDDKKQNIYDVANLFALEKAKEKYGINKVITFHRTIEKADSFSKMAHDLSAKFKSYHVNGNQNSNIRKQIFTDFKQADTAYITNSRCLTEGIDTPDVDAVAFLDPRSGLIDVVQAIGRTVRLSKNKEFGYVILPLYVWDLEHSIANESIGKDTAFKNIVDVVSVLRSEDEDFRARLTTTHAKISEKDVFERLPIEILGNLPVSINNEYLYKSIAIEVVSDYDTYFVSMLERLDLYVEKHGHGYVYLNDDDQELALWANAQRSNIRYKTIAEYRQKWLDEHGFISSVFEYEWHEEYLKYKKYKDEGVDDNDIDSKETKKWIIRQKGFLKNGRLKADRLEKLKKIGFSYQSRDEIWLQFYNAMIKEMKDQGLSLSDLTKKNKSYEWVRAQRRRWDLLGENRQKMLLDLGWEEYVSNLGRWKDKALT